MSSAHSLGLRRITTAIGAVIEGVDLRSAQTPETVEFIHRALLDHGVLFFQGQRVDKQQYWAFMQNFGLPQKQETSGTDHDRPEDVQSSDPGRPVFVSIGCGAAMIKLQHVGISVSNLESAIDFYTRMFGMEVAAAFPFGDPLYSRVMGLTNVKGRMAVVRKDGLMLELFEFANPLPGGKDASYPVADRGISHFGIEVNDINATYERMVAGGVRFHSPVTTFPGGVKATYGRDQDGNVFELLEMPERAGRVGARD